ncbi:LysE family translocator [Roseicyclus mahoneyensis]|uniref:Threonine/homoserine/homoserine lactone efflux protein n=1 Tax=Roseicyclus mahoneyensis TaxID=164332 RepID=A0A316G3S1_9RHOB|nr:LysE family translocator [Roseicyclus mahoneyensis]PWK55323.1 threonine/homoserine/homoserine lactone efflux protein [Roseicyclus mahoneyensis]
MPLDSWLAFVAASVAILVLPGPTVMLVISLALTQGRRVALATAAGAALGGSVALSLSLAGVGALVMGSPALFTVLKWVGVGYLMWLGAGLWRSAPQAGLTLAATGHLAARDSFARAATVTVLNPKGIAFFMAFAPQFIDPARPYETQAAMMVPTYMTLAAMNALGYALMADLARARLLQPAVLPWVARVGAAGIIAMALLMAVVEREGGA